MKVDLEDLITHDSSEDCVACRAQDIVGFSLIPAMAAWEEAYQLPRHSLPIHGAAALIAYMMQSGLARNEIESVISQLLDEYEMQIAEEGILAGPTQGSA